MKRICGLLLCVLFIFSLSACSAISVKDNVSFAAQNGFESILAPEKLNGGTNKNEKPGFQFDLPEKGEEIAVMETSMGTVKIRLFPAAAPKAVYNFKALAETGYYDGIIFHRVIGDFMIQSGDPTGTGRGGNSIWGKDFADEFSENLLNLRGSLSMANAGPNTNGSQFFINQNGPEAFSGWNMLEQQYDQYKQNKEYYDLMGARTVNMDKVSSDIQNLYTKYGGNPTLDGAYTTNGTGHTVFGQVFEGMDVIDRIASVKTVDDKPVEDVTILSLRIEIYE